jgi:type III secretion protein Q
MNAVPRPEEIETDSDRTTAGAFTSDEVRASGGSPGRDASPARDAIAASNRAETPGATRTPSPVPTPLSDSAQLVRISDQAMELARLYGRGPLHCSIDDTTWLFRWRSLTEPITGVELHLRVGDATVTVGLETLTAFGCAADVTNRELPARLRAPYLNGIGVALWQRLEAMTERAVQVLEVHSDSVLEPIAEHLGFEIGRAARGPIVRGFLQVTDTDSRRRRELQRVLSETSLREMSPAPLPSHLRLRWSAVVGSTSLPTSEVCELEEHDVILIDDAKPAANALSCWLGVGPTRRYAGRLAWRKGGQLQMVQFGTGGGTNMSSDVEAAPAQQAGFDEIPVNLRFELAQWNASLAEVGNLAPGAVVDIGERIDEHAVSVWVEQRCIGKGQLVAIGERLGVRLVSVFAGLPAAGTRSSGADSVVQRIA